MIPSYCEDASPTFFGLLDVTIAPPLLFYSYIPILILTVLFAVVTTHLNPKNRDAYHFVSLALSLALLVAVTFMQWIAAPVDLVMFSWQLWNIAFVLTFMSTAFFVYSFTLGRDNPLWGRLCFYLAIIPIIVLTPTTLNVHSFDLVWCQGNMSNWLLWYTYGVCFASIGWILFAALRVTRGHSRTELSPLQFRLIFFGALTFLLLFLGTTMLGDFIGSYEIEVLGPLGTLIFLIGVSYVAATYKRFNIGLNVTELMIVAIVSLIGSIVFIQSTEFIRIITEVSLVFITVIGIFLSRSIRKELEQRKELERISHALAKANTRLKALDKQKSEFVSIASHQLRSPLTSIRGYASMLLEGSFGNFPEKAKEPITRIEESSKLMALAIEDYLNVSRIESGNMKYNFTDFNLRDTTEKLCDDLRPDAIKRGLMLVFRSDLKSQGVVHADLGKTVQIIQNLVHNAIKYTQEGSVKVLVRDDLHKKRILIDIIDTGIGMDEETRHHLFQKFERAKDAHTVNTDGTGLGLYVAHQMTEAMHGSIEAHSDGPGKGSRFTISMPLAM